MYHNLLFFAIFSMSFLFQENHPPDKPKIKQTRQVQWDKNQNEPFYSEGEIPLDTFLTNYDSLGREISDYVLYHQDSYHNTPYDSAFYQYDERDSITSYIAYNTYTYPKYKGIHTYTSKYEYNTAGYLKTVRNIVSYDSLHNETIIYDYDTLHRIISEQQLTRGIFPTHSATTEYLDKDNQKVQKQIYYKSSGMTELILIDTLFFDDDGKLLKKVKWASNGSHAPKFPKCNHCTIVNTHHPEKKLIIQQQITTPDNKSATIYYDYNENEDFSLITQIVGKDTLVTKHEYLYDQYQNITSRHRYQNGELKDFYKREIIYWE